MSLEPDPAKDINWVRSEKFVGYGRANARSFRQRKLERLSYRRESEATRDV
jgi:hypothetical protein